MTIAAQAVVPVDFYAKVREEVETLIRGVSNGAGVSHVALGRLITEALDRIGARTYQARLDELFAGERQEASQWALPEGT